MFSRRLCRINCSVVLLVMVAAGCERYEEVSLGELDLSVEGAKYEIEFKNFERYMAQLLLVFHDWEKETRPYTQQDEEAFHREFWGAVPPDLELIPPGRAVVPLEWPLRLHITVTDKKTGKEILAGTFHNRCFTSLSRSNDYPLKPFVVMPYHLSDETWIHGALTDRLRRGRTYLFKMEVLEPDPDLGRCELIFRGWY